MLSANQGHGGVRTVHSGGSHICRGHFYAGPGSGRYDGGGFVGGFVSGGHGGGHDGRLSFCWVIVVVIGHFGG